MQSIRIVLQAGGRGRRMGRLTESCPKPLLPVGGVPMVERLLRQVLHSGARRVSVITGWLGERVEAHLKSLDGLPDDLELSFVREEGARGNVGALSEVHRDAETYLFSFGDLVTDLDFAELLEIHRSRRGMVTLTSHYESHRLRLGELLVEGERVVGYQEKPKKDFLICSGIVALEAPVIEAVPKDRPVGLSDLVARVIERGWDVSHWLHGSFWMDLNSPEELARAETAISGAGISEEAS